MVFPSSAYTNLTTSVAEYFARRTLKSAGFETSEWIPLARYTNENAIVITFHHAEERFRILRVTVELEPNSRIVCTVNPQ